MGILREFWSEMGKPMMWLISPFIVLAIAAWLYDAHRLASDCTAICKSRGHERFATDTATCFCAGPEGAYSPGLSEAQPHDSTPVVVPMVMPIRTR